MSSVVNDFSYFVNSTGKPLNNGYIYFGVPDTNPSVLDNQIPVTVQQEDGALIRIPQPVRTNAAGIAVFLGNPIKINLQAGLFSVRVEDYSNNLVYTRPRAQFGTPSIMGQGGNYLTNNGSSVSWGSPFPDQSGNESKTLSTNGTVASWEELLPDQSGQAGKTLSTDGSNTLWSSNLPDQFPSLSGNFLFTDGTIASWENPFFPAQIVNNTDTVHDFNVNLPLSGKVLVISSAQLFITENVLFPPLAYILTINLNGNIVPNRNGRLTPSSPDSTLYTISSILIEGSPGDSVNINSTTTAIPLESADFTYSLYNHLTVVIGGY